MSPVSNVVVGTRVVRALQGLNRVSFYGMLAPGAFSPTLVLVFDALIDPSEFDQKPIVLPAVIGAGSIIRKAAGMWYDGYASASGANVSLRRELTTCTPPAAPFANTWELIALITASIAISGAAPGITGFTNNRVNSTAIAVTLQNNDIAARDVRCEIFSKTT